MLVLLLLLQRFGHRQWGNISELTTEDRTVSLYPIDVDGSLGKEAVGINFFPEDTVHSSWTLLGRATTVIGANREGDGGDGNSRREPGEARYEGDDGAAIGDAPGEDSEDTQRDQGGAGGENGGAEGGNGPGGTNTAERDPAGVEAWRIYNQARDAYRKGFDDIAKSHNLVLKVSWPEVSRLEEWKIIGRARTLGEADELIKGHIPVVHCARDFGHYSTRHIRDFLGIELARGKKAELGSYD